MPGPSVRQTATKLKHGEMEHQQSQPHSWTPACPDPHSAICTPLNRQWRPGRAIALQLARLSRRWQAAAAKRMPIATGDVRKVVGQPIFMPLYP